MKSLSILLTDDQSMFREGVELILKQHFPQAKLYQAGNGKEALDVIAKQTIDVVLLDVNMPGMNGIEVSRIILRDHPETKIIILTQYNGEAMIATLLKEGVHGFLLKNSSSTEIIKAIDTVFEQEMVYVTPSIHPSLSKNDTEEKAPSIFFTKREAEILMYLKMGKSSKEIAERLALKENTINSYREDMLQKTQTRNVAELISYAYQNGVFG
ncbi:MAG TPA: response regulator transcription factor [Ohtaekwangia sp.]